MTSAELTGWLAYLQVDDEVKAQWATYSVVKAFKGDQKDQKQRSVKPDPDEEIIDTTDPDFAKNFKGFTHAKPQPRRPNRQSGTEILFG